MFITCHSYVQSEINMLIHVADSIGFNVNTFTHILEGYKWLKNYENMVLEAQLFLTGGLINLKLMILVPYNASLLNEAGVITAINF